MEKVCVTCHQPKAISEFHRNRFRVDGFCSKCCTCANAQTRAHYHRNKEYYYTRNKISHTKKREILRAYKRGLACVRCGFSHPAAIDFHHPNPKIKDGKALQLSNSIKTIMEEIKKCVPLCSNCHRILHYEERA